MKKIFEYIKIHKFEIIIFVVFFSLLSWCALNTFVINDDLPYSLFNRTNERITNIFQILRNQYSDYLFINGRFIIHSIVQFVLMFDKNLFAFLNAGFIILTIIYAKKIIDLYSNNLKKSYVYLLLIILFLILYDYKYLLYWVAGSVNYIWLFSIILIFIYYYLKNGLFKNKIITAIFVSVLSISHECAFVFVISLLVFDFIKNHLNKEKVTKKDLNYLYIIIPSIFFGLICILAPGNMIRVSSQNWFYDMPLFERLIKSIPSISTNLFNLNNIYNFIPLIYMLLFIIYNLKKKNKFLDVMTFISLIISILSLVLCNGYLYLLLIILITIMNIYNNYNDNQNELSVIWLSILAPCFALSLTPEYSSGRINYYFYIWLIINILVMLNKLLITGKKNNILGLLTILLFLGTILIDINIFYNIGLVKKDRLKEIKNVKENNLTILNYKLLDDKYSKYQADPNEPSNEEYWAYKYFIYYYELNEDVKINLIK